jgi:hypothetical protein
MTLQRLAENLSFTPDVPVKIFPGNSNAGPSGFFYAEHPISDGANMLQDISKKDLKNVSFGDLVTGHVSGSCAQSETVCVDGQMSDALASRIGTDLRLLDLEELD